MVRIGKRTLGPRPTLVLALSRNEAVLRQARQLGVDAIEFRIDGVAPLTRAHVQRVARALQRHGLPLVATVRSQREGGAAKLSTAQRAELYDSVMLAVDAIDVEIASAPALARTLDSARRGKKTVILSFHDFKRTPATARLEALVTKAKRAGADIVKIAATPRLAADVIRLFEFTDKHRRDHIVVIAMGGLGSISRLLFPLAGSLLTYTNVTPSVGQVPLRQFAEHLKLYYPAAGASRRS